MIRWDALIIAACAYLVGYLTRGAYTLPDTLAGTFQRVWLLLLMGLVWGGGSVFAYSLKGWLFRENQ